MPAECCLPDCNVLAVKFGAGGTMLCFLFVCFFWGWPVPLIPFVVKGMHGWMTYAWKKLTQTALEWCRMEIVSQTPKSNIRVWHKCTLDEQANIPTDRRRILVETLFRRVKANSILTPMDLEWDVIKAPVVDKWLITFACIVCFVITSQSYKGKT